MKTRFGNEVDQNDSTHFQLMQAVKQGNLKQVEELIKAGIDVNLQNASGQTALSVAAENGKFLPLHTFDAFTSTSTRCNRAQPKIVAIVAALFAAGAIIHKSQLADLNAPVTKIAKPKNLLPNEVILTPLPEKPIAHKLFYLLLEDNQGSANVLFVLQKLCEQDPIFCKSSASGHRYLSSPDAMTYLKKLETVHCYIITQQKSSASRGKLISYTETEIEKIFNTIATMEKDRVTHLEKSPLTLNSVFSSHPSMALLKQHVLDNKREEIEVKERRFINRP